MNIHSWVNTNHSFPEGEGGYSNIISGIKPLCTCPCGIWHRKLPWNSGIISHTAGITHHRDSTGTWGITHQTLNFINFHLWFHKKFENCAALPCRTEQGDPRLWFKEKIQDLRNPPSLLSQNTTAIPSRLLRAQLNTALNHTLNSH